MTDLLRGNMTHLATRLTRVEAENVRIRRAGIDATQLTFDHQDEGVRYGMTGISQFTANRDEKTY